MQNEATRTITLVNDFHRSETTIKVHGGTVTADQLARAERKLCGMSDCACAGVDRVTDHSGDEIQFDRWFDGKSDTLIIG